MPQTRLASFRRGTCQARNMEVEVEKVEEVQEREEEDHSYSTAGEVAGPYHQMGAAGAEVSPQAVEDHWRHLEELSCLAVGAYEDSDVEVESQLEVVPLPYLQDPLVVDESPVVPKFVSAILHEYKKEYASPHPVPPSSLLEVGPQQQDHGFAEKLVVLQRDPWTRLAIHLIFFHSEV